MLGSLNKKYFIFTTFLYLLIGVLFEVEMMALFIMNYLTVVAFTLFIDYLIKQPDAYFVRKKLILLVFSYSFFFVFCYNLISFFYNGNFYIFSEADAILYHEESSVMANMGFIKSIEYYLSRHEVEDLGIVLILSNLYKIAESKLLLNVFYLFIAIVTALSIYGISKWFMPVRYAFLCAITYCFSSYVLWFHSSGLKESLLVILIIFFYHSYYAFVLGKKPGAVFGIVIAPLLLLLFRPVLALFCVLSITAGIVLKRKASVPQLVFLFIIMFAVIYFMESIVGSTDKFLLGGTESMLEIKQMEGMVKGSVSFTYLVNILSSMFGPFPTLNSEKVHLSFYAPGLIFKIFISLLFWFGLVQVIRLRLFRIYPMLIFILFEMGSLTYILEALELRKSLPHFPMIYVFSFIFIYRFDTNQLETFQKHLFYKKTVNVLALVLCALVIYWNFR